MTHGWRTQGIPRHGAPWCCLRGACLDAVFCLTACTTHACRRRSLPIKRRAHHPHATTYSARLVGPEISGRSQGKLALPPPGGPPSARGELFARILRPLSPLPSTGAAQAGGELAGLRSCQESGMLFSIGVRIVGGRLKDSWKFCQLPDTATGLRCSAYCTAR